MAKMPARNSLKRKNRDVSDDEDRKIPPEEIKVVTMAMVVATVVNDPSSSEEEEDCKVTASMTTKVLDQNICHPLTSPGARPSYCSFSKVPRRRNKVFTWEMQVLY